MLHRLPHGEPGRRPVLNEIQPDLNPLEVLFDVKKLTTVAYVRRIPSSCGVNLLPFTRPSRRVLHLNESCRLWDFMINGLMYSLHHP